MQLNIEEEKFYGIVRNAVSDVVKEEMIKLRMQLIPYTDEKEMKYLESLFSNPENYDEQEFEEIAL